MIKAVMKSEIKRVSGILKDLSLRRIVPRSRKQLVSRSVPWKIRICTNFLYLQRNLLKKLHHRLPWASSLIQVSRGKTTVLMLCLSKIEGILRLGHNVFQQLSESWILFWCTHLEKIGYFAFVVSIFQMLIPCYPLIGFLTGLMLVCAWLSMNIPVITHRQVFNSLRLSKDLRRVAHWIHQQPINDEKLQWQIISASPCCWSSNGTHNLCPRPSK